MLLTNSDNTQKSASKIKQTIVQLLSNLANPKEIEQYMKRFASAGKTHFAVIKVGGAVIENDLNNLCSSLAFLEQIGLFPIVVHGAGPQLNKNLDNAGIDCEFISGQRVTSGEVLSIAHKTFVQQNLKLVNALQSMGVKSVSLTGSVFTAKKHENQSLGMVGEVTEIDLAPIESAIQNQAIPILSSIAETESGQLLNINADMATNHLAIALKPYKIIFLTQTGGLLNEKGKVISTVSLVNDYNYLMQQDWVNGGMQLKLKQIAEILSQLPSTASVSVTTPAHLAKELFTHKGSGTLIRRGESIMQHTSLESIKAKKLKALIEVGFQKTLTNDYFESLNLASAFITYCYRAAAITTKVNDLYFLDKFVVAEDAKGEGLGTAVWEKLCQEIPEFFWRSKVNNPINAFYHRKAHGCYKTGEWITFWYGLSNLETIDSCIRYANNQATTLIEASYNSEQYNEN